MKPLIGLGIVIVAALAAVIDSTLLFAPLLFILTVSIAAPIEVNKLIVERRFYFGMNARLFSYPIILFFGAFSAMVRGISVGLVALFSFPGTVEGSQLEGAVGDRFATLIIFGFLILLIVLTARFFQKPLHNNAHRWVLFRGPVFIGIVFSALSVFAQSQFNLFALPSDDEVRKAINRVLPTVLAVEETSFCTRTEDPNERTALESVRRWFSSCDDPSVAPKVVSAVGEMTFDDVVRFLYVFDELGDQILADIFIELFGLLPFEIPGIDPLVRTFISSRILQGYVIASLAFALSVPLTDRNRKS